MSFLSVEPQSRVLLDNYSNSLLVQFDTQLGVIADRYLAFFQERRSIEATYIESLRNLHHKAKTVDASFDPQAEPTTTRAAWEKVRDNLEREANTQQAFVDILDNDVIKPLITLKKTKDQTGKWIEEDLKESATEYADYAENTVSKLQQAYFNKHHSRYSEKRVGARTSTLFRGRQEGSQEPELDKSEEGIAEIAPRFRLSSLNWIYELVSDDDCRRAIRLLNNLRFMRVETLEDGYDCLEELVFTPVIKNVLVKYMNGMVTARTLHDDLAMITRTEVEKALAGTDTSNLKASFRQALSFSIPPITLYRNYRPSTYSDSDLIFGVPLVDLTTNQDNVPKVMRMCIEEVEKRGLNISKIYSFRHRLESKKSFSFGSADNIHSIAMLLMLYLLDLPEPLFILSLQDYRNYGQNRARYAQNGFSLLRSKIRELHPVQRATLETLLRHLSRVSSHANKNGMTVKSLAANFRHAVLRGNEVLQDGVSVKACCNYLF
ncbi:Rho GTPase activation protein [Lactarius indigo]|nr:Rho GTPase activation protein [Lactarius indigo]